MGVKTGKGWALPIIALLDIYVIWIITSLPGLAISPIEGDLKTIFPGTSEMEIQLITTMPAAAAIPFIFIGGALGTRFNNIKLINLGSILFAGAGALCFVANHMWQLIALSVVAGVGAGIVSPLSVTLISNIFVGKYRTKQFGLTSALINVTLIGAVIATGYMAQWHWRSPFVFYIIPIIPILLTPFLKKYVKEPKDLDESKGTVKFKFSKQCNVPALVRNCVFYGFITVMLSSISLFIPFMLQSYGYSSGMTGDLTAVVYVGIMIPGFTLPYLLKFFKNTVYDMILLFMAIGFLLMILTRSPIVIGIGIFLGSFFYGIGQPYCYDRCSTISTAVASTLTMAWLISMNSVGEIACPFFLGWAEDIFGTKNDPVFPYYFCLILTICAWVFVFTRRLVTQKRQRDNAAISEAAKKAVSEDSTTPKS